MNSQQELIALDTIFSGFFNGITIIHENEKYDGSDNEWIRLSSQTGSSNQITLGDNPRFRYNNVCYVQIFTSPDSGSSKSLEISDAVTDLLRGKTLNGLTFKVPKNYKVGVSNGWYQVNVLIEFYRED